MKREGLLAASGGALLLVTFAIMAVAVARRDVPQPFTNGLARGECMTGELAANPIGTDGFVLPETRSFTSLEEAQAFACFRIPAPLDPGEWRLVGVQALRSHDLGTSLTSGLGHRSVSLGYQDERHGTQFRLDVIYGAVGQVSGAALEETTIIQGAQAKIGSGGPFPGFLSVSWNKDGVGFIATASLTQDFTREDVLRILESIR